MGEVKFMKGNEVVAHAAVRCGCDGYFGYPITPQTEVIETLMELEPWNTTGMVVVQCESETASINMVYGGASAGKRVMTSSSSPGVSLMCEGLTYLAGAELPSVILNVARGGPGLGTIQPSQSDYFQAVKGGGHGDYHAIVLAPASVQDMYDFVELSFDLAFKYLTPVIILSDGVIGQMMEKVTLKEFTPRLTEDEIFEKYGSWATTGKRGRATKNLITSVSLDPLDQEAFNHKLQAKYRQICEDEVRYEEYKLEDAEYMIVAYGSSARISMKAVDDLRAEGVKVGLLRPITLYPFPYDRIKSRRDTLKGFLSVEMSAGQMVEDVRLAVEGHSKVDHFGRYGGAIHSPHEVVAYFKQTFNL